MRNWYKTLLVPAGSVRKSSLDESFEDHRKTMGGYPCDGYESKNDFFQTHIFNSPRHVAYHEFLSKALPSNARTLSIASGRCANELLLAEKCANILCSDIEPVCGMETLRLFDKHQFIPWNCMTGPHLDEHFDVVISLSFIYLLDYEKLQVFFGRMREQLFPGGLLLLDGASSADAFAANLLHEYWLPFEARCLRPVFSLYWRWTKRGGLQIDSKHHGFRYSDAEIIESASRAGFTLEFLQNLDFENEWDRSLIYRHVLKPISPIRRLFRRLGKAMPYVRMFAFRLSSHT